MKTTKKTVQNIEGFLRWASRHDMTISFSTRANYRPDEEPFVSMRVTSNLRGFHFEKQIDMQGMEMSKMPFSVLLMNYILDYEMALVEHDNMMEKKS